MRIGNADREDESVSRYLLVIDLRDDFTAIAAALSHYEGASQDASFVVLVPEQEPPELQTTAETEQRTMKLRDALQAAGMCVSVIVSARDVVEGVDAQLRSAHFDEIIVASPPQPVKRFFGVDMWHRLQRAFDIPVMSLRDADAHRLQPDDFSA
jgi:hypothetical protein